MKKIMIMMSAALLLSSCGLYNKYERPTVDSEGIIRDPLSPADTLAVAPQDTASFGNMPWRSVFTDPQLQQLIEQGLAHNANLQNAALTVKMYESILTAAKLAFLPAITLGSQQPMGTIATMHTSPSVETKSYSILPASHHPWLTAADGYDCHDAHQPVDGDEELFDSHLCLMDHRPLRQYPFAEAFHPDETPGL